MEDRSEACANEEKEIKFVSDDLKNEVSRSDRGTWGGQCESILTLIGYAVGFANIWRFPYLCYKNGGGVFVLLFVFFILTCGFPLFYMEVILGQFSGKSPIHVWAICPLFKGIGLVMVCVSTIFVWYYSMMIGWVYYYFIQSFYPTLSWATCHNDWNTLACTEQTGLQNHNESNFGNSSTRNQSNLTKHLTYDMMNNTKTPAMEFWENNVLVLSSGIDDLKTPQWHLIGCLFLSWVFAFLCLVKGVKSVGKVVYFTVLAPYILLTVLLIRGATLDGAWDGLKLYLYPDFNKLADIKIWTAAILQVFYSLGTAWGCVITMASYNRFHHNAFRESMIVCAMDAFTCVYAGLPVFAILGHISKTTGKPLEHLQSSGPGLVFIAYPEALSRLPLPNLWSVLFFATLILLGIDSLFSTFETVSTCLIDVFYDRLHKYKTLIVAALMTTFFITGIPLTTSGGYYIIFLVDWYFGTFNVVVSALLEVFAVNWIYGADRLARDAEMMIGYKPSILMRAMWCAGLPLFIVAINIMTILYFSEPTNGDSGYKFPSYAITIGKLLAVIPACAVPVVAIAQVLFERGPLQKRLQKLTTPSASWGPNDNKANDIYKRYPYVYKKNVVQRTTVNVLGISSPSSTGTSVARIYPCSLDDSDNVLL